MLQFSEFSAINLVVAGQFSLWQYHLWSFRRRDRKLLKKSTVVKRNYWILRIEVVASCQKVGIILENKVILKLLLSKNVNNKKCATKFVFFNGKKISKIWMIFDIDNWLWKSDFGTFWHFPITPICKNPLILFDFSWFLAKNLSDFVSLPWKLHNRYCHPIELGVINFLAGNIHI